MVFLKKTDFRPTKLSKILLRFLVHFSKFILGFLVHFWKMRLRFLVHFSKFILGFLVQFWKIRLRFLVHFSKLILRLLLHFWNFRLRFLVHFSKIRLGFLVHSDQKYKSGLSSDRIVCAHIQLHKFLSISMGFGLFCFSKCPWSIQLISKGCSGQGIRILPRGLGNLQKISPGRGIF